jgi:hypothetical protein
MDKKKKFRELLRESKELFGSGIWFSEDDENLVKSYLLESDDFLDFKEALDHLIVPPDFVITELVSNRKWFQDEGKLRETLEYIDNIRSDDDEGYRNKAYSHLVKNSKILNYAECFGKLMYVFQEFEERLMDFKTFEKEIGEILESVSNDSIKSELNKLKSDFLKYHEATRD